MRTQRDYWLAFKLAVVDQIEKGECSYKAGPGAVRYPERNRDRPVAAKYSCLRPLDLSRLPIAG